MKSQFPTAQETAIRRDAMKLIQIAAAHDSSILSSMSTAAASALAITRAIHEFRLPEDATNADPGGSPITSARMSERTSAIVKRPVGVRHKAPSPVETEASVFERLFIRNFSNSPIDFPFHHYVKDLFLELQDRQIEDRYARQVATAARDRFHDKGRFLSCWGYADFARAALEYDSNRANAADEEDEEEE